MTASVRRERLVSVGANALASGLPQLIGLVLLASDQFGHFAFVYLFFALASSWLLSLVCEPWATTPGASTTEPPAGYRAAVSTVALLLGLAAGLAAWRAWGVPAALAAGIAVSANACWFALRFGLVLCGRWRRVAALDVVTVVVLLVGAVMVWCLSAGDTGLLTVWAVSGLAAVFGTGRLALPAPRATIGWLRANRSEIRRLLPESLLLDLGAVGVPFLMVPQLSARDFGVYRAVSNVAFPVRIVLLTVRPVLARDPGGFVRSARATAASAGVLALVAGGAFVLIEILGGPLGIGGVIGDLLPHAAWAALFVFATGLGQLYYMCCRYLADARALMVGRLTQTALVVALPLAGMWSAGLEGAIAGFVVSAGLAAAVWVGLALRAGRTAVVAA